jgi:hypothetical protein
MPGSVAALVGRTASPPARAGDTPSRTTSPGSDPAAHPPASRRVGDPPQTARARRCDHGHDPPHVPSGASAAVAAQVVSQPRGVLRRLGQPIANRPPLPGRARSRAGVRHAPHARVLARLSHPGAHPGKRTVPLVAREAPAPALPTPRRRTREQGHGFYLVSRRLIPSTAICSLPSPPPRRLSRGSLARGGSKPVPWLLKKNRDTRRGRRHEAIRNGGRARARRPC